MLLEFLYQRRSVRKYLNRPIEESKIDALKEAALLSPSSRSLRPWEFIFINDKEKISYLSKAKAHGSSFLANAPLAVVIIGDPLISDVWVEDCSIATLILQLVAEDLGLGSCWIQIRNRMHCDTKSAEDYIKEALGLPQGKRIEAILSIGYPDEKHPPYTKEQLCWSKIHDEIYFKKP